MAIGNHDALVNEIINRNKPRTVTTEVPGQRAHTVTVEQGQDAVAPSSAAGPGQIDASMRGVNDTQALRVHGPETTQIEMPSSEPKAETVVTIGALQVYPNQIGNGYERNLTRGGNDTHFVMIDGERVHGEHAVGAIYDALLAEQNSKKGGNVPTQ